MRILHTMLRVGDLERSIDFYTQVLGMRVLRKSDYPEGRFTNAFVGYEDESRAAVLELTHNWDTKSYDLGSGYGHVAHRSRRCVQGVRRGEKARRQGHARGGADEARHDRDRIRRRPGRLQDRVRSAQGR